METDFEQEEIYRALNAKFIRKIKDGEAGLNIPDDYMKACVDENGHNEMEVIESWKNSYRTPNEALQIIQSKFENLVAYACERAIGTDEYEKLLWNIEELIQTLYPTLNAPSFDKKWDYKNDHNCKPRKLWRMYNEDVFSVGSDQWEYENYSRAYSPVSNDIDEHVSRYMLINPLLHHPYINWSIINAYLIDAGRMNICQLDREKRVELGRYGVNDEISSGHLFKHIENKADYDKFKWKNKWKKILKGLRDAFIGLVLGLLLWSHDYKIAVFILFVIYIAINYLGWALERHSVIGNTIQMDKERKLLLALKDAWIAANSPSINLLQIKEKVAFAESLDFRYPPTFHALLAATIDNYGSSISVVDWLAR